MEILRLLLSLRNVQVNLKDTIPDEREKKVLKFWRHLLALSRLRLIEAKRFDEYKDVLGISSRSMVEVVFQPFFGMLVTI